MARDNREPEMVTAGRAALLSAPRDPPPPECPAVVASHPACGHTPAASRPDGSLLLKRYASTHSHCSCPPRLDPIERPAIGPRGPVIGAAAAIRMGPDVRPVDLVVQSMETTRRGLLRLGMQRPLRLPN